MRIDQYLRMVQASQVTPELATQMVGYALDLPCNAQCPECGARETDISFDEGDAVNPSPLHKVEFGRFYLVDDQNNARVLSHFANTCRVCRYRWLSRTPSTEFLFEEFANGKVGASFEDWDDKEAVKSNAYAFLLKGKRYAADHSDFEPNVESQMQMVEAYLDAKKPQAFVVNVREGLRCVVMTTVEGSPIAGITKLPKDCVDVSRILGPEWRHPK